MKEVVRLCLERFQSHLSAVKKLPDGERDEIGRRLSIAVEELHGFVGPESFDVVKATRWFRESLAKMTSHLNWAFGDEESGRSFENECSSAYAAVMNAIDAIDDDVWERGQIQDSLGDRKALELTETELVNIIEDLEETYLTRYQHVDAQFYLFNALNAVSIEGDRSEWQKRVKSACTTAGFTIADVADAE